MKTNKQKMPAYYFEKTISKSTAKIGCKFRRFKKITYCLCIHVYFKCIYCFKNLFMMYRFCTNTHTINSHVYVPRFLKVTTRKSCHKKQSKLLMIDKGRRIRKMKDDMSQNYQ